MPILKQEPDLFPEDLFENPDLGTEEERQWLALYTLSRREKDLMRRLRTMSVSFYCPLIAKTSRSPSGRARTAYMPLFSGYVFLYGSKTDRYSAMTTNCISRCIDVPDQSLLTNELRNLHQLVASGLPITPESKLEPGDPVRIKSGSLAGLEGVVVKRQNKHRLLVSVDFLQQGASVSLDDWELEPLL